MTEPDENRYNSYYFQADKRAVLCLISVVPLNDLLLFFSDGFGRRFFMRVSSSVFSVRYKTPGSFCRQSGI